MSHKMFDAKRETEHIIQWIRNYFAVTGPGKGAVIGISGGKDSTVAAALLARAIGPERVFGVLMPDGVQADLDDSYKAIETTGINAMLADVGGVTSAVRSCLANARPVRGKPVTAMSENACINTPPRTRMTVLYAVAASIEGGAFVCNTCNASEDYIGYSTKHGDAAGDFSPLADYTVTEIIAIGRHLGLPDELVAKTPSDGLCGMSDEDRFGFSYVDLDWYIRTEKCEDAAVKAKIDRMHAANLHKLLPMPHCPRLAA